MHLIDTDVLWTLRGGGSGEGDASLVEWAATLIPTTVFISVVSLLDLQGSAGRLERTDKAGAVALHEWLTSKVGVAFAGRILAVDDAVVRRWSQLGYADLRDGLIAATALEHGLFVATRTPQRFKQGKVKTINPWTYSPDSDLDWRQATPSAPQWLKSLFVRA
ncbi:type II toxin-antitoxin system VapC family toxin [Sphingomonas piscis]|uniref:Type II toxin-antitoxin system VapC family toxin n=1 Tax=Sphingomonas piscis TaxID=2714943 RepID=A0A6G7YND7_9SPHN|nr:type II toxin-antitoxin system VapC family toxin [Sphingomonas piscis]QIK78251.1 type II toxin-antitoxin system VapC family toxin [Sphingomonas piscis]